ncbi:hypothetical protein IOLA_243 [uncultured bacterium]|nr:hypothetical protein IOLA_243 [uncultured bacterium]
MSKNNYKVMLTSNSSLGFAGKSISVKKGYAKFLYKINKILPICRKCNLQAKFLEKSQILISKLNDIKSINIYRETNISLIRNPIVLSQVLKELVSQNKEISGLGIFGFKFNNINEFGTYKLDILHLSKKVCSIDIVVHNVKK